MVFLEQLDAIIFMLALLCIALYFMFKYVDKLMPYKKHIDFVLVSFAIISMTRHYVVWTMEEKYYHYLPFQVCYLSMFIYIYFYFSKDRRALPFLHIFGFLGIGALFAPGMDITFTDPLSYIFMIDHVLIGVMPFYIVVSNKYYPQYKNMGIIWKTFIPLFMISIPLSRMIHPWANYFYLLSNPITGDSLNPWLVALLQIGCMYLFGSIATHLGQLAIKKSYPEFEDKLDDFVVV